MVLNISDKLENYVSYDQAFILIENTKYDKIVIDYHETKTREFLHILSKKYKLADIIVLIIPDNESISDFNCFMTLGVSSIVHKNML